MNPPFSRNVSTNVAKRFLNLLDTHFPKLNKLHKLFNGNTVKLRYCCTENLSSIIKTHNKKVTNEKITPKDQCNCRNKNDCPLDGNCQTSDIIHKCIASTTINPDKIYLGTAEGNFKSDTIIARHHSKTEKGECYHPLKICMGSKGQNIYKETPSLKWLILKSVPGYSNITKKCLLCLHEKLEIINYPDQEELLNKRSELISKCRHVNKYLLSNYKSND